MNIAEIKEAINTGKKVYWNNYAYEVREDSKIKGRYLIVCVLNNDCIGLTNVAGDKLNGNETDFFY